jgi:hypothetical protein
MTTGTNLTLSDKELSIIQNREWFYLKYEILDKVNILLSDCSVFLKNEIIPECQLPEVILNIPPKISKGENYKFLPYQVLDYPRYFSQSDVFAIRTMFWWGNFISITLHVSGTFTSWIDLSRVSGNSFSLPLYICVGSSQWEHHFEKDNYRLCCEISEEEMIQMQSSNHFFKLAFKFSLSEWDQLPLKLKTGYKEIRRLLVSFPADEKDLLPDNPKVGSDL